MPLGVFDRGHAVCDVCGHESTKAGVTRHKRRHEPGATYWTDRLVKCGFCGGNYVYIDKHISDSCKCSSVSRYLAYMQIKEDENGCWFRTGGKNNLINGSRKSYEVHNSICVLPGYVVCHTCDVRDCLNPSHMFVGTQSDNINDMYAKSRFPDLRGDKHWTRRTEQGRTKARNQMSGPDAPMRRPEVVAKVSGDNHWSRRYPEKFAEHQRKMSAAAAEKQLRSSSTREGTSK